MQPLRQESEGANPGAEYRSQNQGQNQGDSGADKQIRGKMPAFKADLGRCQGVGQGQTRSVKGEEVTFQSVDPLAIEIRDEDKSQGNTNLHQAAPEFQVRFHGVG